MPYYSSVASQGSGVGYIAGGSSYGNVITSYDWNAHTFANLSAVLSSSRDSLGSTSNADMAIINGGTLRTSVADKMAFVSKTIVSGYSLGGTSSQGQTTFGNSTIGMFANGYNGSSYSYMTYGFTYATLTAKRTTNIGAAGFYYATGCGNTAEAIIAGGSSGGDPTTAAYWYQYAGDTVSSAPYLATPTMGAAAASSATIGLIAGGKQHASTTWINTTSKYAYAGHTRASGTVVSACMVYEAAMGNAGMGVAVFVGGNQYDSPSNASAASTPFTFTNTFATDTWTTSTYLPNRIGATAFSNCHSGL